MKIVADFRVINDFAIELTAEKPLQFNFEIPGNLARGGDQSKSAILVKYFLEGASALTWDISLNATRLLESSGSGSHLLMNMEAFEANLLLPGENCVEIRWLRGLGIVRIADMMINYHVTI